MNWEAIGNIGILVCNTIMLIVLLSNRSEKRVVSISPDTTSHTEFIRLSEQNRQEHTDLARRIQLVERNSRSELDARFNALMASGENRGQKIHERINEVLQAVSELRGEVHSKRP